MMSLMDAGSPAAGGSDPAVVRTPGGSPLGPCPDPAADAVRDPDPGPDRLLLLPLLLRVYDCSVVSFLVL